MKALCVARVCSIVAGCQLMNLASAQLVDEFNGTSLDPVKWYVTGRGTVTVSDGTMKIREPYFAGVIAYENPFTGLVGKPYVLQVRFRYFNPNGSSYGDGFNTNKILQSKTDGGPKIFQYWKDVQSYYQVFGRTFVTNYSNQWHTALVYYDGLMTCVGKLDDRVIYAGPANYSDPYNSLGYVFVFGNDVTDYTTRFPSGWQEFEVDYVRLSVGPKRYSQLIGGGQPGP